MKNNSRSVAIVILIVSVMGLGLYFSGFFTNVLLRVNTVSYDDHVKQVPIERTVTSSSTETNSLSTISHTNGMYRFEAGWPTELTVDKKDDRMTIYKDDAGTVIAVFSRENVDYYSDPELGEFFLGKDNFNVMLEILSATPSRIKLIGSKDKNKRTASLLALKNLAMPRAGNPQYSTINDMGVIQYGSLAEGNVVSELYWGYKPGVSIAFKGTITQADLDLFYLSAVLRDK